MEKGAQYLDSMNAAREMVQEHLSLVSASMDGLLGQVEHEAMAERLRQVLSRKGKQVRSTLMLLLARTGLNPTQDAERLARTAASIELVHTASLLHDDVIDETDMRRGAATAHAKWGNKLAVLTGDFVLARALELVILDEDRRLSAWVSRAAARLIAGEIAQLDFRGKVMSRKDYGIVIDGKTASLIEAAAACGAILAGHDDATVVRLSALGRHFGLAFQIIDDLLDYGFGAAGLDKATLTDLKSGLMTLPLIQYCETASPDQKEHIQALRQDADNPESLQKLVELLQSSGCFQSSFAEAQQHVDQAVVLLESLPSTEARDLLMRMCQGMLYRGY